MIVDDSTVARAVLSRMIESDPAFEIAAVAGTAEAAVEALGECRVDIVLLDLEMPGAGGLKSIPRIIAAAAGAKVMIVSSLAEEGAEQTVAALALGAADTLPKPGTGRFNGKFSEILLGRLKALGYASVPAPAPTDVTRAVPRRCFARCRPIPSTCSRSALQPAEFMRLECCFKRFPKRIGVPILVTQHLPIPFIAYSRASSARSPSAKRSSPRMGWSCAPTVILLAPGDAHLTRGACQKWRVIRLTHGRGSSGCMPSVDPMLASVGAIYGGGALGVVLTGMGRDGVEGASRLVACGGSVIAQDEASCAVWGMPRAVLEAGLASAVLAPDKIARRIASRTEELPACK